METKQITEKAKAIRGEILKDKHLKKDIDKNIAHIPEIFMGNGEVKVIIIGQDPTIRNEKKRKDIEVVLNIGKGNSLQTYIERILKPLGLTLDNLYATNYYKCFFKHPPADDTKILTRHFRYWLDLIKEELAYFPDAKIFTLGEPLIEQLITSTGKHEKLVKYYWDYYGEGNAFKCVEAKNNVLGRELYPLPHQPSIRKKF